MLHSSQDEALLEKLLKYQVTQPEKLLPSSFALWKLSFPAGMLMAGSSRSLFKSLNGRRGIKSRSIGSDRQKGSALAACFPTIFIDDEKV